jgi:hypothetical protein
MIEPRTVATLALTVGRSINLASSHLRRHKQQTFVISPVFLYLFIICTDESLSVKSSVRDPDSDL